MRVNAQRYAMREAVHLLRPADRHRNPAGPVPGPGIVGHIDDRETTEKAFWNRNPCMSNCRPPQTITGRARAVDVTPDETTQKKSGVE